MSSLSARERSAIERIMQASCWTAQLATLGATVAVLGFTLAFLISALILSNEGLAIGALASFIAGMVTVWLIRTVIFYRCIIQKLVEIWDKKGLRLEDLEE
ncbi:MAG: hypothetical protein H5U08_09155 [Thermogutta sp.]|uniref:hypothetical protein n=1 Tax=Thermogutta sp. TaxID=1962930 RepID=UPI001997F789|nr:hypothetical protein [Thermogutta sp.]MBC7352512.1 hypothetical protein [Thermogutta sp.]